MKALSPLICLLLSLSAHAETAEPGVGSSTYMQLVLGLGLILGLVWLLAFVARTMLGGKGFGQGGLKLLGGIALGPKERIVLVEAGEVWLVVGIVPGQIRTLHTLPKGQTPGAESPHEALPFAQWLKKFKENDSNAQ